MAVNHNTGPCITIAPPGSGKTFILTKRIERLIKEMNCNPESILVITFTKAAALEMQQRFLHLMSYQCPVNFGTFHAVFLHILQASFGYHKDSLLNQREKENYMKTILFTYYKEELVTKELIQTYLEKVKKYREDNSLLEEQERYITERYLQLLEQEKRLDFDMILSRCFELLERDLIRQNEWKKKWKYIMIDEFQDINDIQYNVVKLLLNEERNLFVVGDDDQSIYGFRGSMPSIMLDFTSHFHEARKIYLKHNFRSTHSIINCAKNLIKHNRKRYVKDIITKKDGDIVLLTEYEDEKSEKEAIHTRILFIKNTYGATFSSFGILFRTNQSMSEMAEFCIRKNIPIHVSEKPKTIYQHFISKDIMAYMSFAFCGKKRKDLYVILNKPVRFLKREYFKQETVHLGRFVYDQEIPWYCRNKIGNLLYECNLLQSLTPFAAIQFIVKGMGYDSYLKEYCKVHGVSYEECKEVINELKEKARPYETFEEWNEVITNLEGGGHNLKPKEQNKEAIHLLTMHSSKGLEFPYVFIPRLIEKEFPYYKAHTLEQIEEERRLLYVGITRAKDKLFLSYIKEDRNTRCQVSRFVKELGV